MSLIQPRHLDYPHDWRPFVESLHAGLPTAPISPTAAEPLLDVSQQLLNMASIPEASAYALADRYWYALTRHAFERIPGRKSVVVYGAERLNDRLTLQRPGTEGFSEAEPGVEEGRVFEVHCSRRAFDEARLLEPYGKDWLVEWLAEGRKSYGLQHHFLPDTEGMKLTEEEFSYLAFRWESPGIGRRLRREVNGVRALEPAYTTEPSTPLEVVNFYRKGRRVELLPTKPVPLHGDSSNSCLASWFHDRIHEGVIAGLEVVLQDLSMGVFAAALELLPWRLLEDFVGEGPVDRLGDLFDIRSEQDVRKESNELLRRARFRAKDDAKLLAQCDLLQARSAALF